ncbi:sulfonate ABC transporter substrate-binding protein [Tumidithrix elongata RA019]|uniref:Putative aliphatic sulfonates-binding protein n=1 Tax=Tumidithrix elongata BACA0141 TaxID=2716417 RepID=A0AAW9PWB2_9CYAN|nr:sulfonate ABC transporter substrate-binding protein [Tumidithrix elongata RA019]
MKKVRIGYQKFNTLNILKSRGELEKALKPLGITVEWNEFAAGPQLLEALNVGSIDFGHAADTPPIVAQAAGTPLVYVAHEPPYPKGLAVVVRKDSPIQSVKDLKGKKIAIGKGWNVFNLLLAALEKEGLSLADIEPVFVSTAADAQAAFQQGSVDVFGIWDPFYAVVERKLEIRTLIDGSEIVNNPTFYLASRTFAEQQPKLVKTILQEVQKIDDWANTNPREVAEFLAPQLKVEVEDLERATKRREYGVRPITEKAIADQQQIADRFFRLKLIPKAISIKESVVQTNFVEKG